MPLLSQAIVAFALVASLTRAQNATEGYIYGYAPVAVARIRNGQLCVLGGVERANTLITTGALATPSLSPIVAPNVDTMYGVAWIDLREGPVVIGIPSMETAPRYHVFQAMDFYTNTFAEIGSRTQGYSGGQHAILPPSWNATVPKNITSSYLSPSWDVWVIARTLVYNTSDLATAQAVESSYSISVLPGYVPVNPPPTLPAPYNCSSPPPVTNLTSGGAGFFDELAAILSADPPPAADAGALENLTALGVVPGSIPSTGSDSITLAAGVTNGEIVIRSAVAAAAASGEAAVGAWSSSAAQGTYGTDYLLRAAIAKVGIGANIPAEARYFQLSPAALPSPIYGNVTAALTFSAGQLPPILSGGFWSVTAYDATSYLYNNTENRYAVSSHQSDVNYSLDGSLTVYFGHDVPMGLNVSNPNWLPTPEDVYIIILRAYTPAASISDYTPPELVAQVA